MSTTSDTPAIRRSALETVHAALGALWIAPDQRWPASYDGSATAPSEDPAAPPVWLAEIGPRDVVAAGGARLVAALAAAGLPFAPGRVSTMGHLEVWGVAPDEAWIIGVAEAPVTSAPGTLSAAGTTSVAGTSLATGATPVDLRAALQGGGAALTEIGAGLVQLRLGGARLEGLLEELCPVDLSRRALPDGTVVGAPLANVRVIIARQDRDGAPVATILAPRDLAEYLWEAITEAGAPYALRPVVDVRGAT